MSDDDYFVSNSVGWMVDDLNDDEAYALLTEPERTATLLWVLDGLVRGGGVEAWIESLGQRSDDAVLAFAQVGAEEFAKTFARAFAFFPNRGHEDPDSRLSGVDSWSRERGTEFRLLDDACVDLLRSGDLIDVSVRRFICEHPEDFPQSFDEL